MSLSRTSLPVLVAGLVVGPVVWAAPASAGYAPGDPSTWSTRQLAAQLTHSCVTVTDTAAARAQSAAGIGGITLLGSGATPALGAQLAQVRVAAPGGLPPLISSDEEGGQVQRLAGAIYPLPSARVMGTWPDSRIEQTAYDYGGRMLALGVPMDLAPDADLDVPGSYIDSLDRSFAADPGRVASAVGAWDAGMRRAGVLTAVKHWPGHGSAVNSHTNPVATVPPLPVLEARDMVPFNAAFAAGVPAVLVGHLQSVGLTEPGVPATESPNALAYLRARTGPDTVIMTDSLTMAAASSGIGLTPEQAAVRALQAGADWALTCAPDPMPTVAAVQQALDTGALRRAQANASARRVLLLKQREGLLAGPVAPTQPRDLYDVALSGTASGVVELHGLAASSGYRSYLVHAATALAPVDPADWRFFVAPYAGSGRPDLFAVHLRGTGSGRVEVHVLSAASGYRTFVAHAATGLAALAPGAGADLAVSGYAGDAQSDLYFVPWSGTASGRVEVHVLAASTGWTGFVQHVAVPLGTADVVPGAWRFLVGDAAGAGDLVAVRHAGATGSGRTEAHVLSQVSGYQQFTLHVATASGLTDDATCTWALGDGDGDGVPDLVQAFDGATGTGSTELHVLGGRTAFAAWTLHTGTGLPLPGGKPRELVLG